MDYRVRFEDYREAISTALDRAQTDIWTALPGIIQSYNPTAITAVVQPTIQALHTGPDNKTRLVNIPQLPDVPVVFPKGGGYSLTFPIKQGDECLCVFSSRCIDNWWAQGGVQSQRELRMHNLSDGFALVGPWSQKTKISNVSTTTTQLRTDDGKMFVELDHEQQLIRMVSGTNYVEVSAKDNAINIVANEINLIGNVHVLGNVNGGGAVTVQADTLNVTTNTSITMTSPTISEN